MIYLDHAATSPLRPEAAEAWQRAQRPGNASAVHAAGRAARAILEDAREKIAGLMAVDPAEVIFTSGGTEADNLAVAGLASAGPLIISAVEHPAVREAAALAKARGAQIITAPVTSQGTVDLPALEELIETRRPAGISVMAVNNETGIIQPLEQIHELAGEGRGAEATGGRIWLHSDAVQGAGRIELPDGFAYSITGHKLGAPVGTGALLCARDFPLTPLEAGGGQERGIRSGTLNVAGAAALAAALEAHLVEREEASAAMERQREQIFAACAAVGGYPSGGADAPRAAHIAHVIFPGADPEALMFALDSAGVCASAGSACSAGVYRPSAALVAMGEEEACAIRFSLAPQTTDDEVARAVDVIGRCVELARGVA
ncbi:MAG: cysteine desulfurase family protein [Flaviflexus sp.]|nr:cysteine desulfurase family protein [Flaviflexus sp.]